jgi:hypothetical protein
MQIIMSCVNDNFLYRTRVEPIGSDRHGTVYWLIQGAVWATNDRWHCDRHAPPAQLAASDNSTSGSGAGGGVGGTWNSEWRCYKEGESLQRLKAFLNPLGPREGRLLLRVKRLQRGAGGGAGGGGGVHGHEEEQEAADAVE